MALITLDEEEIVPWASEQGLPADVASLVATDEVRELVQDELDRVDAEGIGWEALVEIGQFAFRSPVEHRAWHGHAGNFRGDWGMLWKEIATGLLLAGCVAQLGDHFFNDLFLSGTVGTLGAIENVIVGPLIAVLSFVCSIGNVPLAVVLWKGGISFGGVVAFIFADLIIAPILNIYRKYHGARMAAFILGTFFAAMAGAGYVIELVFGGLGLIPSPAAATIPDQGVSWDYTTWLNIVYLLLAATLIVRFARTGGRSMLRMMGGAPEPAGAGKGGADHAMHKMADGGGEVACPGAGVRAGRSPASRRGWSRRSRSRR